MSGDYANGGTNLAGITVTAGCSRYVITNNMLNSGNTFAAFVDNGSLPKIVSPNLV